MTGIRTKTSDEHQLHVCTHAAILMQLHSSRYQNEGKHDSHQMCWRNSTLQRHESSHLLGAHSPCSDLE
jgi:hypothetical protein